jgi:hypothetical protein
LAPALNPAETLPKARSLQQGLAARAVTDSALATFQANTDFVQAPPASRRRACRRWRASVDSLDAMAQQNATLVEQTAPRPPR